MKNATKITAGVAVAVIVAGAVDITAGIVFLIAAPLLVSTFLAGLSYIKDTPVKQRPPYERRLKCMYEHTTGKWYWDFSDKPETFGKPGIFIEGDGPLLKVQVGDLQLMANAPEMHEMLWKVSEELGKVLTQGTITKDLPILAQEISSLLKKINVERM